MSERLVLDVNLWKYRKGKQLVVDDLYFLHEVDNLFLEAEEKLISSGISGTYYESISSKLDEIGYKYEELQKGIDNILNFIAEDMDESFYRNISNGCVDQICEIDMMSFETENTVRLTQGATIYSGEVCDYVNRKLKFNDFLGFVDPEEDEGALIDNPTYVEGFSSIFKDNYDLQKEELRKKGIDSYDKYMEMYVEDGMYDHKGYHPELNEKTRKLDMITCGIKPLVETGLGYDLVTKEKLSDEDAGEKFIYGLEKMTEISIIAGTCGSGSMLVTYIEYITSESLIEESNEQIDEFCTENGISDGANKVMQITSGIALSYLSGKFFNGLNSKLYSLSDDGIKMLDYSDEIIYTKKIVSDFDENDIMKIIESKDEILVKKILCEGTEEQIIMVKKYVELDDVGEVIWKNVDNINDMGNNINGFDDGTRNEGGSKTPSEIARSWQGTGKYPGIDDYVDVTVNKGTVLYRGEPNGTEYFTTLDAIEKADRNATNIFEGLQVEKNPIHGYRGEMQGYVFNEDIASAYGITNANPQFGKGGLPQYYVPNVQDLIDKGILTPVDSIKLTK